MKKQIAILMALIMALSMTACRRKADVTDTTGKQTSLTGTMEENVMKVLEIAPVEFTYFDLEKKQITLGYKTEETHPWKVFKSQYAEGDVLDVTISNLMSYGAFAKITDDVDGLIHVSQIALDRVDNPADVLASGQNVTVKITKIDDEQQRVSLSIKALLEEETAEEAEATDAE